MAEFSVGADGEETRDPSPDEEPPSIEFLCAPELWGRIPVPERAVRFVPEWFKRLERELAGMTYPGGLPAGFLPVAAVFASRALSLAS